MGYNSIVSNNPRDFKNIKKILLVGVGSFNIGMMNLKKNGFDKFLTDFISNGGHILGICLGFQILFSTGSENCFTNGLNLINGSVESISKNLNLRVPHMGWNNLNEKNFNKMELLKNIPYESNFYFIHSYYAIPNEEIHFVTSTYEDLEMCAIIEKNDQIFGTQFHPEKSQKTGMIVFNNFINL